MIITKKAFIPMLALILFLFATVYRVAADKVVIIPMAGEVLSEPHKEIVAVDQSDNVLGALIDHNQKDYPSLKIFSDQGYTYWLHGYTGEMEIFQQIFHSGASCSGNMYVEPPYPYLPFLPGFVFTAYDAIGAAYLPIDAQEQSNVTYLSKSHPNRAPQCVTESGTKSRAYQVMANDPAITGVPFNDTVSSVPAPIRILRRP